MTYKFSHLRLTLEVSRPSDFKEICTATIQSEYSGKDLQVSRAAFSSAMQRIVYEMLERGALELDKMCLQSEKESDYHDTPTSSCPPWEPTKHS